MRSNEYFYLTESEVFDIPNEEDVKFLKEFKDSGQSLISSDNNRYRINFVGEVITPNNIYFSFPKNIPYSEDNLLLIKKALTKYSKDKEGKSIVISKKGSYSSERAYFNRLKEYFLDFITYEFIYPLKRKKVHSKNPIIGGKISIVDTIKNRKRYGSGITYKTKDVVNSDDWMLDDIYYFTIKELEDRLGVSKYEKDQIESMTNYLKEEGYQFNTLVDGKILSKKDKRELLDFSKTNDVINAINKSEVGIIHYPIKNTLLEYYKNKQKAAANSSVNVIFTNNFEKFWELILQNILQNNSSIDFKDEIEHKFKNVEIIEKFIPQSEVDNYKNEYPLIEDDGEVKKWMEIRGRRHFICERGRILIPDIFVELKDGRRFLGDVKYYKDPSDANYDKEFYIYNDAQGNEYPMVIFAIPEESNIEITTVSRNGYRRSPIKPGYFRELIIITVSVKDVIEDAIKNKDKVLKDSINLISKYTRRWEKNDSK